MITNINQLDLQKTYSYADYLTWKFDEQIELFLGKIQRMSPAPRTDHQRISRKLTGVMIRCFNNNTCEFFIAPFDVRLLDKNKSTSDAEVFTVVQPDLCVICDPRQIDDKGAFGAPNLVVEILSPGNSKKEMKIKFDLYQQAGVTEYWIINPENKSVLIYLLKDLIYVGQHPLVEDDAIQSFQFPTLKFNLDEIF